MSIIGAVISFMRAVTPVGSKRSTACAIALLLISGVVVASDQSAFASGRAAMRLTRQKTIVVIAKPLAGFEKSNSARRRFGRLLWRGGLVLTSQSKHFGGWSGLTVDPTGRRLLAVSDAGLWLKANLAYQRNAPVGLSGVRIGPLTALSGRVLKGKRERDAEGVTLLRGGLDRGRVLISFERLHRIGVFPVTKAGVGKPISYLRLPAEKRQMTRNKGIEAVAVLKAGRLRGATVAFAERLRDGENRHRGWLLRRGRVMRLRVSNPGEFDVTDAVGLANGDLLMLERRFRWSEGVQMRLRLLSAKELEAGAPIKGEVLFAGDMSYEIDNMEGLAVHRTPAGKTVITLISDNNFRNFLQRTLLLQFTLLDRRRAARAR